MLFSQQVSVYWLQVGGFGGDDGEITCIGIISNFFQDTRTELEDINLTFSN